MTKQILWLYFWRFYRKIPQAVAKDDALVAIADDIELENAPKADCIADSLVAIADATQDNVVVEMFPVVCAKANEPTANEEIIKVETIIFLNIL